MSIDPKKVNLSEKDLEDYLFEHPEAIKFRGPSSASIVQWLGRQVKVPSGIIDLLGLTSFNTLAVIEVKNTEFEAKHLTQVSRYAYDIEEISNRLGEYRPVLKVLIGPGNPTDLLITEADALQIHIMTIEYSITAKVVGPWYFKREHYEKRNAEIKELAASSLFSEFATLLQVSKIVESKDSEDDNEDDSEDIA